MIATHEPWLVALSVLVAFQGSYVGLHLARGVAGVTGLRRRQRITGAAISLALAIWTMHFVGMLAIRLPLAVDFLVLPTLLSFLICALVVGFAVFFVALKPPTRPRLVLAAALMGAGIVTMHYLGMQALHASLHMTHDPVLVTLSIGIGVAASGAALTFGFGRHGRRSAALSALVMALAIAAMHYTAMAGTHLHGGHGAPTAGQPALSPGLLAVVVSVVAFLVSGLFLLSFVPETDAPAGFAPDRSVPEENGADRAGAIDALAMGARPAADPGLAPRTAETTAGPPPVAASAVQPDGLPVERDGCRRLLDVARVQAVQADGHYTRLFDGESLWFCPLSIGEVEARLDGDLYARIHRSHIVRLDRIAAVRKAGDADQVALSTRMPYRAPVARARRSWLRQRLADTRIA